MVNDFSSHNILMSMMLPQLGHPQDCRGARSMHVHHTNQPRLLISEPECPPNVIDASTATTTDGSVCAVDAEGFPPPALRMSSGGRSRIYTIGPIPDAEGLENVS